MIHAIADAAVRRRSITLGVAGVLAVLAVLGALRLRVDFSSTAFYGDDSAAVRELEAFTERWGADDRTALVLVRADDDWGVLTPRRLRTVDRMTEALDELPSVESTHAITNIPLPPSGDTVIDRLDTIDSMQQGLQARTRLLAQPTVVPLLVSENARSTAIIVTLAKGTDDLAAAVDVMAEMKPVLDRFDGEEGLSVMAAGLPAVRAGFFSVVLRDQAILVPTTALVMAVVLWIAFRRGYALLVTGTAAGLPLLGLLGLMGWAGEPIGLLNQSYFTLILVITVADSVHVVARTREEARGLDRGASIEKRRGVIATATGRAGRACLLTTLTTSLGFASLAVAGMPILRAFGLWAAVGIALGFVVVVTVVPALLSFVSDLAVGRSQLPARPPALLRAPLRRPWITLAVTAVLVGLAAWGSTRVVVDNRLTALLDEDHPTSIASHIVDEELGGILSLEVELRGPPGTWRSDTGRERIAELTDWAVEQPGVRAVLGPQTPGIGEQYVSPDGGRARISLRVADVGGRAFARLEAEVAARVGSDGIVTGTSAVAYRGVNRLTHDLRLSLLLVFVVVTVVIAVLTRSLRTGLISILPNLLPLGLGYGALGLLGIQLDPLAAVVLVVALGIAVDDTIHLLVRWQEERRTSEGSTEAIEIALARTGRAVTITTAVLALGLAVSLLSSFPPLRLLGGLGAAVIAVALLADLWVLPALLVVTRRTTSE